MISGVLCIEKFSCIGFAHDKLNIFKKLQRILKFLYFRLRRKRVLYLDRLYYLEIFIRLEEVVIIVFVKGNEYLYITFFKKFLM